MNLTEKRALRGGGRDPLRPSLARWLLFSASAAISACGGSAAPDAMAPMPAAAAAAPAAEGMAAMAPPPADAPMPAPASPPPEPMAKMAEGPRGDVAEKDEEGPPQWAPVRQFPTPNYAGSFEGPRSDFRETIFWQPSLRTDDQGKAQVEFYLSDAVTSFRGVAEGLGRGGLVGHGESVLASKLPVSLATKLPLEVSAGDVVELPVTITNATWRTQRATLVAQFGSAFQPTDKDLPTQVELKPQESRSWFYGLRVSGDGAAPGAGAVTIGVESARLRDAVSRTIKVVPAGFPREASLAGTITGATRGEVEIAEPLLGSLHASLQIYPSPKATLVAGTEALLQEPTGCFEQASSANYPNLMVAGYLAEQGGAAPDVAARSAELLDRGYKKLVGYESPGHGYEWFGGDPGHEALTAYGLMEFSDMAKVYKDLDQDMVKRTAEWLKGRRDGAGGYKQNEKALDSFGAASPLVTSAYITYALTEVGEKDLGPELAAVKKLAAGGTKDPYVLALAANALVNAEPAGADTLAALKRLAGMQAADGHWAGADHSITRSGGIALDIETAALAALALMKSASADAAAAGRALEWIAKQREGSGGFGSTQSTVLALKALTRAAGRAGPPPEGTIAVRVNGGAAHEIKLDATMQDTITLAGLAGELHAGKNAVEILPSASTLKLPYSVKIEYRTLRPASSGKSPVTVALTAPKQAKAGEPVKVRALIANGTAKGIPMVIARLGIPGGLVFQTWQLDELKQKGLVDFYETREREVIVYFRSMGPKAQKAFDLDLLAAVPGSYTAPASQAYLYYTDENRSFADPLQITVTR